MEGDRSSTSLIFSAHTIQRKARLIKINDERQLLIGDSHRSIGLPYGKSEFDQVPFPIIKPTGNICECSLSNSLIFCEVHRWCI